MEQLDFNKIEDKWGIADYIIEIIALVGLIVLIALPLLNYNQLPDEIPAHYNVEGEVDRYGNKLSIIFLPLVGIILYALLTFIPRFKRAFSFPVEITQENAQRQFNIAFKVLRIIKMIMVLMFMYILYSTISIASGGVDKMNPLITGVTVAGLLFVVIFYIVKAIRTK